MEILDLASCDGLQSEYKSTKNTVSSGLYASYMKQMNFTSMLESYFCDTLFGIHEYFKIQKHLKSIVLLISCILDKGHLSCNISHVGECVSLIGKKWN